MSCSFFRLTFIYTVLLNIILESLEEVCSLLDPFINFTPILLNVFEHLFILLDSCSESSFNLAILSFSQKLLKVFLLGQNRLITFTPKFERRLLGKVVSKP